MHAPNASPSNDINHTSVVDVPDITAASTLAQLMESTLATLSRIAAEFSPAVFASSLAAEDMVLTDLIAKSQLPITIFTLETGRLHPETLAMLDRIKDHYKIDVTPFRPDPIAVDAYIAQHGLNAFYDSVEMRKECCRIRKVEPLQHALSGNRAWITGQRRAQSTTRASLDVQEADPAHGMIKFNPLADWSEANVWDYIHANNVPYNPLHDQGYPSIGCQPCTRALEPGEDIRAGRWWWENPETKECGLHMVDGKLIRIKSALTDSPTAVPPDPVVD
jgi:phosphoadenosine phosphosulfate reductase